jgi:hypothetical protein
MNTFPLGGWTHQAAPEAVAKALDAHRAERIRAEYYVLCLEVDAQVARRQLADHDRAQARARMPW